ncbi:MAG TPA: M42 family metallopeptidase [Limnochordia bacterium]|nr:M42 family metallopeptidase [Limnochordia bacterium]HKM42416.1 M42 family metallopeptidase [Limnochordia bacterium]
MPITFSGKELLQIINELVSIPSPSGYTDRIIDHIADSLDRIGVENTKNRKGAVIATVPGKNASVHRLVTAHVDTLGAMVKEIKSDGRLRLTKIGGSRWAHVEGEYCKIFTTDDNTFTGTILMHQTSVHVYKDASTAERNQENMEVRLDARVKNADEVKKLGISVGDFVAFDPRVEVLPSGFIKSRHLDDKASASILLYLLQEMQEAKEQLPFTTHFLFSNYEETGFGGNSNIPAAVAEYLAVDMGAIGDGQMTDEYTVSICAMDSTGPYNARLRQHLVNLAEKNNIEYQVDIYPFYGSDASAALRAGHDIVHGLIGPGIDASHAFERTHVDSVVNTAKLVYFYLLSDLC